MNVASLKLHPNGRRWGNFRCLSHSALQLVWLADTVALPFEDVKPFLRRLLLAKTRRSMTFFVSFHTINSTLILYIWYFSSSSHDGRDVFNDWGCSSIELGRDTSNQHSFFASFTLSRANFQEREPKENWRRFFPPNFQEGRRPNTEVTFPMHIHLN